MFCKKCGNELKEDAKFCPKCGTKVDYKIVGAVLILFLAIVISSIFIYQKMNGKAHNDKTQLQISEATTVVSENTASENDTNTQNNTAQISTSQDKEKLTMVLNKYIQYVKQNQNLLNAAAYDVLYINDDTIPEIAIEGSSEAQGTGILYYANDQVNYLQLDRLQFFYIKNSGLLCNAEGNMGYYYDIIYSFGADGAKKIAEGQFGIVDEDTITSDSDGNQLNQYQWEGKMVSEDQYQKERNAVFDYSKISYDYYQYQTLEEAVGAVENATRGNSFYVVPFSNRRYLTQDDLKGLTKQELELAKNEIYAQMGCQFTREDLKEYFTSKSWYYGYTNTITDDILNEFQRANIKLIQSLEEK